MYGQKAQTNTKSVGRGGDGLKEIKTTKPHVKDWGLDDSKPFDPSMWLAMGFKQYMLFGGNNYASRLPDSKKWIVWDKRGDVAKDDNGDAELIWTYNVPGPTRIFTQLWKGIVRQGEENCANQGPKLHTFQKPVSLCIFCLKELRLKEPKNTIVVDPYAGSFSIGVACERLKIRWIGIEIRKEFCETGKTRMQKETSRPHLFSYEQL